MWIEIKQVKKRFDFEIMSPSAWRVWIEIKISWINYLAHKGSPSAWRVWIEMSLYIKSVSACFVALRMEGVD